MVTITTIFYWATTEDQDSVLSAQHILSHFNIPAMPQRRLWSSHSQPWLHIRAWAAVQNSQSPAALRPIIRISESGIQLPYFLKLPGESNMPSRLIFGLFDAKSRCFHLPVSSWPLPPFATTVSSCTLSNLCRVLFCFQGDSCPPSENWKFLKF